MKHEAKWNNILQIIKDKISKISFNTCFRPIKPVKFEENILTIQVPSGFFYEYLEEHYLDLLKKVMIKELGAGAKLEYQIVIDNSNYKNTKNKLILSEGKKTVQINTNLNVVI